MPLALALLALAAADPWALPADFPVADQTDRNDANPTPPPPGAKVLLGDSLDAWEKRGGGPAGWRVANGVAEGAKGAGDVVTKEKFAGSFRLHVEFRVPYEPGGRGQGRGNSGVYLQGRYEIQVLDSYGVPSAKGDCGAVYGVREPLVNACKAPTVWQAFDIDFRAPVFEGGKKVKPARVSVRHNGRLVQDGVDIPVDNTTSGLGGDPATPGPILLQDHGHPVQYRNVWLLVTPDAM